ncbi:MAG TPA: serine/threonine-protein kinase, partial [Labilithrix sp.]|nr:serine/threonine-protein kinase [Labilithrix sp.]
MTGANVNADVGQVIAGKYELVRLLGRGAMGEVWLATHNSLGGEFAIKLVAPTDDAESETAAARFQLEAQIAAKLSRKTRHIVSVSDHGEENGLAYLVMERLEGESLESKLARGGALSLPEVATMIRQVGRALSLCHEEGILHRDLKPANVWLGTDEDGRLLVKLLDFGIARVSRPFPTRSPFATSKDMVLGTPSYMSPEQARGLDTLDYRCDLWALAVIAYEALTTTIPFDGKTVEDIFFSICTFRVVPASARRSDLPAGIDTFFGRAFSPELEDRFVTALELTESFEELLSPDELELAFGLFPPPGSAPKLEAARRSNPRLSSGS